MESKNKETAVADYMEMIKKSWTYNRLTDKEKKAFDDVVEHIDGWGSAIKGSWQTRTSVMNAIYYAFISGCGYNPDSLNWRNKKCQK